jgi:hypothetical protein
MTESFSERKQHQIPTYLSSPAAWLSDPWDLSGDGNQERWWTGMIWSERTRKKENLTDRDTISVVDEKEKSRG